MRATSKACGLVASDRHSSTYPLPQEQSAPPRSTKQLYLKDLWNKQSASTPSTPSTPASAPASRLPTSSDNSPHSESPTPVQLSSATSQVDSTSSARASEASSSSHSMDVSVESTSPTETDCVDLHSTSSSTCSTNMVQPSSSTQPRLKSLMNKNSRKTFSPSSPSSGQGSTASEADRDESTGAKKKRPNPPPVTPAAPAAAETAQPPPPPTRRRVPWFEPHHRDLFDEIPPPTANAAPVAKEGGWWATRTWSELPQPSTAAPLRPRVGNLKQFKGSGPYAREHWLKDMVAQEKRNKVGGCGRGKKRTADGADAPPPEPTYLRTIKTRVRFVGTPAERNRQIQALKSWMGSARYTYNSALRGVRTGMPLKKEELRERYVSARQRSNNGQKPTTDDGWVRKAARDDRKKAAREASGYEVGELLRAKPWLKFTPNDIRDGAILDLVDAEHAMQKKAQLARQRGDAAFQKWTLTPKDKSEPSGWTIKVQHRYIEKVETLPRPTVKAVTTDAHNPNAKRRNWTRITMFSRSKCADGKPLGSIWLSEDVVSKFGPIDHDCRLTRDRRGKFHLLFPVATPLPPTVPEAQREPCALDPGVRTFQAVHSRAGHGTYGDGDFERVLEPICTKLASLQAVRDRVVAKWEAGQWTADGPQRTSWLPGTNRQRGAEHGALASYRHVVRRLNDRMDKLRKRLSDLVDELHKRVALDLCTKFDTVLIPTFDTGEMAKWDQENGGRRKLLPKTVRALLGWAHYRFRAKLKHKALMLGKEAIVVDESYTTKGCSRCGEITEIGGSKTFTCKNPTCGFCAPRDPKSARDILTKHILPITTMGG